MAASRTKYYGVIKNQCRKYLLIWICSQYIDGEKQALITVSNLILLFFFKSLVKKKEFSEVQFIL